MFRNVFVLVLLATGIVPSLAADLRQAASGDFSARRPLVLAQFFPQRNASPTIQYPQQQQNQPAPQFSPSPAATPVPTVSKPVRTTRRPAAKPKRRENSASSDNAKKDEESGQSDKLSVQITDGPRAESGEGLSKMVKALEKEKEEARRRQAEGDKAADDATTAVAGFLRAANAGKYSDAFAYLTPELQKYFQSEISAVNGSLKTVLDEVTRRGDILSVTYVNAAVLGEGAVIDAEITFGSGSPEKRSFDVIKLKPAGWKIILPVAPRPSLNTGSDHAVAERHTAPAPPAEPPSIPSAASAGTRGHNPFASTPVATPTASMTPLPPTPSASVPETSGISGTKDKSVSLAVSDAPWKQ
jgi:hypothetical protein